MRKANTAIIRNYYPIPTLDEVLYEVNGAKILSKLDLVEVYYKIVLNENSGDMATFSTPQRFFPYKRLISGAKMRLKNSRKLFWQISLMISTPRSTLVMILFVMQGIKMNFCNNFEKFWQDTRERLET